MSSFRILEVKHTDIGTLLKTAREAAGLSQSDVSNAMGYQTPQYVSNIERNVTPPPANFLKKVAVLYKIHYESLAQRVVSKLIEDATSDIKRKYSVK